MGGRVEWRSKRIIHVLFDNADDLVAGLGRDVVLQSGKMLDPDVGEDVCVGSSGLDG